MIETLLEQVATYPGLYVACTFSGLGMPIPEDVPLLVTGLQLSEGRFSWGPALTVAAAGVVTRDTLAWMIGHHLGERLLQSEGFRRLVPAAKVERAQRMLDERGAAAVLVGRFLIGFRVPMFIAAGAAGVSYTRFIAWDLLGMLVALPLMIGLGYQFGPPALAAAQALLPGTRIVPAVVFAAAAAWLVSRRLRARGDDGP